MAACVAVAVVVSADGFGEAGRALFVIPAIAAGTTMDAAFGVWRRRRREIRMHRQAEEDRERTYRSNTGRLREAGLRHAIMREEVGRYRVPPAALVPVSWIRPQAVPGPGCTEPGVETGGEPRSATGVSDGVPLLAPIAAEFTVDGHPLLVRSTVRHLVLSLLAAIPRATLRVTCGGWCARSRLRSDGADLEPSGEHEAPETPHCTCGEWLGVPYLSAESSGYPGFSHTSAMRARGGASRQRPGGADEKRARGGAALSRRTGTHAYVVGEDKAHVESKAEGQRPATATDLTMDRQASLAASEHRTPTARSESVVPPHKFPALNIRFRHATRGPPDGGGPPRWQVVVCLRETNETEEGRETEAGSEIEEGRETEAGRESEEGSETEAGREIGQGRETGEERETAVQDRALTVGRREYGARPGVTLAVLGLPPGHCAAVSRPTAPEAYADRAAIGSHSRGDGHAENGADGEGALGVEISDDRGWSVRGRIFDLVSRDDAQEWARRNGR